MIGRQIRVRYTDGRTEQVQVTHYALGRLARWARLNGMAGLSPDDATAMADQVLIIQVCCWAEVTRGQVKPQEFDMWVATVGDFDPAEDESPLDPTQPAT